MEWGWDLSPEIQDLNDCKKTIQLNSSRFPFQGSTFIRYVDSTGKVHVKFFYIRPVGPKNATSDNLVVADYDVSPSNHVAVSCDGAAAMFGRFNGVAK